MFVPTHWTGTGADAYLPYEQAARMWLHTSPWQAAGDDLARLRAALPKGADHVAS